VNQEEYDKTKIETELRAKENRRLRSPLGVPAPEVENVPLGIPKTVPLVIYIGMVRRIVGTATVTGDGVIGYVNANDAGDLERLINDQILTTVYVKFGMEEALRQNAFDQGED
jgi:hypothetical protein